MLKKRKNNCVTCKQFARTIGIRIAADGSTCFVAESRRDFKPIMSGRRSTSPLSGQIAFTYQKPVCNGRTLCLGNVALTPKELELFQSALRRNGIRVSSVHTNWVKTKPMLVYAYIQSMMHPLTFARRMRKALRTIRH